MPATIGFDVDGVLGDYPGFIKSAAKELGITITATRYPDTWFMIEDGWFSNRDEWAVCHEWVLSNCRDMPWLDVHAAEQSRILKVSRWSWSRRVPRRATPPRTWCSAAPPSSWRRAGSCSMT